MVVFHVEEDVGVSALVAEYAHVMKIANQLVANPLVANWKPALKHLCLFNVDVELPVGDVVKECASMAVVVFGEVVLVVVGLEEDVLKEDVLETVVLVQAVFVEVLLVGMMPAGILSMMAELVMMRLRVTMMLILKL